MPMCDRSLHGDSESDTNEGERTVPVVDSDLCSSLAF